MKKPEPKSQHVRVALYARVSTNRHGEPDGQTTDTQVAEMNRFCGYKGWPIVERYVDQGRKRVRTSRPALDQMMADAKAGKFDVLLVWAVDRFGCTFTHAVMILETLQRYGVRFVSVSQNLDTSTPMGEAMLGMLIVFANMERRTTSERIKARHRLNATRGVFPGPKVRAFTITNEEVTRRLRRESLRQIAASVGCSAQLLSYRLKHPAHVKPLAQ